MKQLLLSLISGMTLLVNAQIPSNGLGGYWPFDGNANDYSGNGNHGAVYGAALTKDRFNNPNHAYQFNGTSSQILVPNSSTIDMSNATDFSVCAWIKTYSNNSDAIPLSKNQWGSWSGYLFFADNLNGGYCTTANHVSFYAAAAGMGDACSDNGITADSNWHFLTGVFKSLSNQALLYVDGGLQVDVGQSSGVIVNMQDLSFGCHNNGTNNFFSGCLDDIRIYNVALTPSEIIQLYNEPNPAAGINEEPEQTSIQIFPNPTTGTFLVQTKDAGMKISRAEIYDVSGRLVSSVFFPVDVMQKQIDLNAGNGVYTVRLYSEDGRVGMKKVTVCR